MENYSIIKQENDIKLQKNCSGNLPANYTKKEILLYASFMLVISIWILCSNILVLLAIKRTPRLQTKTGIFIASLAVADILCGLFLMPSFILGTYAMPKHNAKYVCGVYLAMQILPLLASITSLVLIGFERYLAIVHPLKSRGYLSKRRCFQLVIGAWILPAILSLINIPWNGFKPGYPCSSRHMAKMYFFTIIYISFWGLLLLLIYLYVAIIKTVCGHHKFVRQHSSCSIDASMDKQKYEKRKYRSDVKLAKMIMLVLGVFCICWIPRILSLTFHYLDPCRSYLTFLVISGIISFMNSGMNMILYAARNKHYCRAFKNIICCRKGQTPQDFESSQDSTGMRSRSRSRGFTVNGSFSSLKAMGYLVDNTALAPTMISPKCEIKSSTTSLTVTVNNSDDDVSLSSSARNSKRLSDGAVNSVLKKTVRFSSEQLQLPTDSHRSSKSSNSSLSNNVTFSIGTNSGTKDQQKCDSVS